MEECVSLTPGLVDMCKHVMAVYHIGYQACKSDGNLDNHTATQPVQMTGKWCRPQLEPYGKAIRPHAKTPCQFEQFILDYLH